MESSSIKPASSIGVNPRHLGLTRRQSYDPLSSTKGSLGLSLGKLPPPTFGNIPAGLRSVPAVESSRHFGSAFRNVTTPNGDGQRTPGGSLVIGAEVFGFGALKKEPRERWGSGSIDGGAVEKSDWPSAFDVATPLDGSSASSQRGKHGSSNLSAVSHLNSSCSRVSYSLPPCPPRIIFVLANVRDDCGQSHGEFSFGAPDNGNDQLT
jgi:hypothetical protein